MKKNVTTIPDLFILEPKVFQDERGYFFESYNSRTMRLLGFDREFVQFNQSKSSYGVIRGLHFQLPPYAQTKLVRVVKGAIYDIAVDIRVGSATFGEWYGIELSEENQKQLWIPKGFAHGFSTLSEEATVQYQCDAFYHPESDAGIFYDDKSLNIEWKIPRRKVIISQKDQLLPSFNDLDLPYKHQKAS